jgi:hypothetical protein
LLDVYLSQTAYRRYQELPKGSERRANFAKCLRYMQDPYVHKDHLHGTFGATDKTFHFFKLRRTVERPFYYTSPNPIHLFPQKPVDTVIVCGLAIEQPNGSYDPSAESLQHEADTIPYKHLSELDTNKAALLVPIGETPMIVTQTYTLLSAEMDIAPVVVLYLESHAPGRSGAHLLADLFDRRGISFEQHPIQNLSDLDSADACQTYSQHIINVIMSLKSNSGQRWSQG